MKLYIWMLASQVVIPNESARWSALPPTYYYTKQECEAERYTLLDAWRGPEWSIRSECRQIEVKP